MTKRNFDVITIGSAVSDAFYFLRDHDAQVFDNPVHDQTRKKLIGLEYGAKINAELVTHSFGGGAFNGAITLARSGLSVGMVSAIGTDTTAQELIEHAVGEHIYINTVQKKDAINTGSSVLLVAGKKHDHVAIVDRGANELLDVPGALQKINKTNCVYLTSLVSDSWRISLDAIAQFVREQKCTWAWNPGFLQLETGIGSIGKYMRDCTVFMVNKDEAIGLVRGESDMQVDESIHSLLDALLGWGSHMVVITDGEKGVYCKTQTQHYYIEADTSVAKKESTGAGDAFGSGFVSQLICNGFTRIPEALDRGVQNAESVIGSIGAQHGILNTDILSRMPDAVAHRIHTEF